MSDQTAQARHGVRTRCVTAEVEVSNFKAEMIRQRNRISRAQAVLIKDMGLIPGHWQGPEPRGCAAVPVGSHDLGRCRAGCPGEPTELYEAELAVRLQQETLRSAQSAYLPSINAVLTGTEANPARTRQSRRSGARLDGRDRGVPSNLRSGTRGQRARQKPNCASERNSSPKLGNES